MSLPNTVYNEVSVAEAALTKYRTNDLARGTIAAANQAILLPYRDLANGAVGVQVVGTFTGTLGFELTIDGENWVLVQATNVTNVGEVTATTPAPGVFRFEVVGVTAVRVRALAWTDGSAVVTIVGMDG